MKPLSTVSGVRISCDTLATKSQRMFSARSRSVMSCDKTKLSPSPYTHLNQQEALPLGVTALHGLRKSPACRYGTKVGCRMRLVTRCCRSR